MLPLLMQIYAILGFVAHLCRDITTGHMRRGWGDISNYAIGWSSLIPLSLFTFHHLQHDVKSINARFFIACVLSGVGFGTGVVIGHWYKPVKE